MRVSVISLDRRSSRLRGLLADWPRSLPDPIVLPAVDGHRLPRLRGWDPGAWGCRASHIRVLEDALTADAEELLVLEDDARFLPHFDPVIPPRSAIHLFGGCRTGYAVLHTHAYAARRRGIEALYVAAIESLTDGHIDASYQRAYRRVPTTYADPWSVVQAEAPGDIDHRPAPRR